MGYRPNASAQSLSRGRSDLFALLVPDLANPYLAELAQRLEEEFFRRDMVLVVGDSHDDQDRESTILEAFRRQQIAGLVGERDGRIQFSGGEWSARSTGELIPVGTQIEVVAIEGATAVVRPLTNQPLN